ncbi:MAG: hemolysin III family protein [Prevotella sp.]|nr:hemolysin III family protein [Prevotella sp.]
MPYTPQEERWNARSHAIGIVLAIVVGVVFFRKAIVGGDPWAVVGVALYLFGMLSSYISSVLYHSAPLESAKRAYFRHWDHAAIYWHIAGSYSPIVLGPMRHEGAWGWSIFAFVWTAAILGTIVAFRPLKSHSHLETICFCLMGLSILVAFKPLLHCVSTATVAWIVAEGVCYITGALFYSLRRRYMHTVFHFFVLAGTLCHVIAVWQVLK